MGIIVLALAVLPRLRVGGRQLLEHEMPGPEIETLTTRIRDTARRLWFLYIGMTAVLFALLLALGRLGRRRRMKPFNAIAYAFDDHADRRLLDRVAVDRGLRRTRRSG